MAPQASAPDSWADPTARLLQRVQLPGLKAEDSAIDVAEAHAIRERITPSHLEVLAGAAESSRVRKLEIQPHRLGGLWWILDHMISCRAELPELSSTI
jgi:hypothetical protein